MADTDFTEAEQERAVILMAAIKGKVTNARAAKQLSLSIRQVQRAKSAIRKNGVKSVLHGLRGKSGNHRISEDIKQRSLKVIKEKYSDFKPSFATEKLAENHNIVISYGTTRLWMIEQGLWKARKQKSSKYHSWRQRKDYFGELQQFDGSYHKWLENRLIDEYGEPQEICLLASIDDATGKITHALFDFNEGVIPVFNFWKEYVTTLGKPLIIYLDKFSTYKINHKMAVDNLELMTQFQQTMKILNIEVINANSPEAKGRIERLFGTLQDRLVKELRLANISSITEANQFLKKFIPKFNNKFSVTSEREGDVHRQLTQQEKISLKSIFSIKSQRRVNFDFTIQFKNHFYQLEQIQPTTLRPKDKVLVEEWLDQTLHFKFKEHDLKYFILPQKPRKISIQPAILTSHPLNWKPPSHHPWRKFKINSEG